MLCRFRATTLHARKKIKYSAFTHRSAYSSRKPEDGLASPWFPNYVISPKDYANWLETTENTNREASRVFPLCAAWFMPNDPQGRTGWAEYSKIRLPRAGLARFFNLDTVSAESPYPHMLPDPKHLGKYLGSMGIKESDTILVYDSCEQGLFSAPRVAFSLRRHLGHKHVHILNNFKHYVDKGFPVVSGPENVIIEPVDYIVSDATLARESPVVDFSEMVDRAHRFKAGQDQDVLILDARSQGRFDGSAPEPRPGLPSGHMPGSINLPFTDLLDPETKALLSPNKLKAIFEKLGARRDRNQTLISTCGTGVTAAVVELALGEVGIEEDRRRLYDGSWTEWAQRVEPGSGLIVGKDDG